MNADIDHSRSSRRPRPEVAVYRPGSGPLKKSSSNVENIQPGSSIPGVGRSEIEGGLASNFRNINLDDDSNKSRDHGSEVHPQEPKSRKTNTQRKDKNASKPSSKLYQPQYADKKKEDPREAAVASVPGKRQLYYQDNAETGSNQDLRQLLLEKRQQRSNESPSAGHSERSPTPSQPSNGKQKNNNRSEQQQAKPNEELKSSHSRATSASNNTSQMASVDSVPQLTRQGDKRSSGRRRNDRKPRVENSYSEGHLVALTNNNSSDATSNRPSKNFEENKSLSGSWNDLERSNGRDTIEGKIQF